MKLTGFIIALLLTFAALGCSRHGRNEGIAIYLIKDLNPAEIAAVNPAVIELETQPIIAAEDIISYNKETHEIKVSPAAFARVKGLPAPVHGKSFAVCIGREIIYTGAFWTPVSSLSYNGIMIMKPLLDGDTLQLEPGYSSSGFYRGSDPRNDSRTFQSLEQAGKLK